MRRVLFIIVTLSFGMISCGPRVIGYGVLLWSRDDIAEGNGGIVPIVRESEIQDSYWISRDRELMEIPRWRVRFFKEAELAEAYAQEYRGLAHTYAYALRRGLPVRDEPSQEARIVYKLEENQVVKVVGRSAEPGQVGVYSNYWYTVLTDDGYLGECFGEFLTVLVAESDPYAIARGLQSQDETLEQILGNVWRPAFFRDMLHDGRLNLVDFRENVGLFSEPSANRIEIRRPRATYTFEYEAVEKVGPSSYQFKGTDLRIEMPFPGRLAVSYRISSRLITETYILPDRDVAEIIAEELERRQTLYDDFRGSTLSSGAYGQVVFQDEMRFSWEGYERLVPQVIPSGVSGVGQVDFRYHLAPPLNHQYDGVISFQFVSATSGPAAEVSFLYRIEAGGVRLVYLAETNSDMTVRPAAVTSWTLFFETGA